MEVCVTFFALLATAYVFIFKFTEEAHHELYVNILGQTSTLVFAIFVGWYAFIEVVRSQAEKMSEKAHGYYIGGYHKRAATFFENSFNSNPHDFNNLCELLELYIISNDERGVSSKMPYLEKIAVEDNEKLIVLFLKTAHLLLKEDLGSANLLIRETINYITRDGHHNPILNWSFKEITNSKRYKRLADDAEAKQKMNNFIKFLGNEMSEEEKRIFMESIPTN